MTTTMRDDRFDQVVAHIDDYIWTVLFTADRKVRPIYGSPNIASMLGEQIDEADVADSFRRYVHPDDHGLYEAFIAELAAGRATQAEYRLIGIDGRIRWIWSRATPCRDGERLLAHGISTDVTDRRQVAERREGLLAREQEQVRRLQELDRLKDELMSMVSHELRNPIGVISAYAEMLREAPDLPTEVRAYIEVVDRNCGHLQHLVDGLLDLARLDSGLNTLDASTVWLNRLVHQAAEDHRATAAKSINLIIDLPQHLHVHADAVRLRQVLDNLLSNAIKYTPDGGTVTVTAAPTSEDEHAAGRRVALTVTDTGIGIPPEQYTKLFTRFFRASTALQAGIRGTGLGLTATKAIVEAHGGTITAAPHEGGGTVFTVYWPIDSPVDEMTRPDARAQ